MRLSEEILSRKGLLLTVKGSEETGHSVYQASRRVCLPDTPSVRGEFRIDLSQGGTTNRLSNSRQKQIQTAKRYDERREKSAHSHGRGEWWVVTGRGGTWNTALPLLVFRVFVEAPWLEGFHLHGGHLRSSGSKIHTRLWTAQERDL